MSGDTYINPHLSTQEQRQMSHISVKSPENATKAANDTFLDSQQAAA